MLGRHPQRALCKSLGVFSRCDPSSPYIHPVGWCHEHGKPLTPPQGESVISQVQPGSASPWEQASQGGMGVLGTQTSCQGSCTHVQVQNSACVRPSLHSEIRGDPSCLCTPSCFCFLAL